MVYRGKLPEGVLLGKNTEEGIMSLSVKFEDNRIVTLPQGPFKLAGESEIYKLENGQLFKKFLEPNTERSVKLRAALNNGLYASLQKAAAVPRQLAYSFPSSSNEVQGFSMDFIEDHAPLLDLCDETYRKGHKLGIRAVLHAFCELHQHITTVHKAGFCIGDLNDQNVLVNFSDNRVSVKLIDVDSWGFAGNNSVPAWKVSAIVSDIDHPKLSLTRKDGQAKQDAEYYQTMMERDWFAFSLHLAHALTLTAPFGFGIPQNGPVLDKEERKKRGLHIWHANIRLPRDKQVNCLRLGYKMVFLLKNWLDVNARGPFPVNFLIGEFVNGLTRCPECNLEAHKSCGRCPQCFNLL